MIPSGLCTTTHPGSRMFVRTLCSIGVLFAMTREASVAQAGETASAPPTGDARIEITSSAASWDNLSELFLGNTPAAAFGDGSVFVMRGELRNKSSAKVHHVVLRYELLDASGKVLHDAEGYNRSAEAMRPDEEGTVRAESVVPLAPGATDSFRMVFFHDEVPRFASQRVRVVEVHEESAGAGHPPSTGEQQPKAGQQPAAPAKAANPPATVAAPAAVQPAAHQKDTLE